MGTYLYLFIFLGLSFIATHFILRKKIFGESQIYMFLLPPAFLGFGFMLNPTLTNYIHEEKIQYALPFLDFILASLGFYYGLQFQIGILKKILANIAVFSLCYIFLFTILFAGIAWQFFPHHGEMTILFCIISFSIANSCISPYTITLLHQRKLISNLDYQHLTVISVLVGGAALVSEFVMDCLFFPILSSNNGPFSNPYLIIIITFGLILLLSISLHYLLQFVSAKHDVLMVIIGYLFFSAGLFSLLHLPPLIISFLLGAILGNSKLPKKNQVVSLLSQTEQPFFIFMLIFAALIIDLDINLHKMLFFFFIFILVKYVLILGILKFVGRYFKIRFFNLYQDSLLFLEGSPLGLAILLDQDLINKSKPLDQILFIYLLFFFIFHFADVIISYLVKQRHARKQRQRTKQI